MALNTYSMATDPELVWHLPAINPPRKIKINTAWLNNKFIDENDNSEENENKFYFDINLNTREIETPSIMSIKQDHNAELILFAVDRYYNYVDLADSQCIIQFVTVDKNDQQYFGLYPVQYYDIETLAEIDKILIPWEIPINVTQSAVDVEYNFRFYIFDPDKNKILFNLNTKPGSSRIENTLEINDDSIEQAYQNVIDVFQQQYPVADVSYESFLDVAKGAIEGSTLYWREAKNL